MEVRAYRICREASEGQWCNLRLYRGNKVGPMKHRENKLRYNLYNLYNYFL